jgi:serine/threonine protein kinase
MSFVPVIAGLSNFELLGKGGSAIVFRARQDQLERSVAVKVLRGAIDEQSRRLFDIERRILGSLPKHMNIVSVYDSGFTSDGDPYLVMELCSRGSLAAQIRAVGPLSIEEVVRLGTRMSSALAFAHKRQMVHRDVKPENVLISDSGEPVLSDFGIASVIGAEAVTTEGGLSPHHVAPELLRGAPATASTDIYSLGSTLFNALLGHAPHQKSADETLSVAQVLTRVAVQPSVVIPSRVSVPKQLLMVINAMLEKDPSKRVEYTDDVIAVFQKLELEVGIAGRDIALQGGPALRSANEKTTAPPLATFEPVGSGRELDYDSDPDATYIVPAGKPIPPNPRFISSAPASSTASSPVPTAPAQDPSANIRRPSEGLRDSDSVGGRSEARGFDANPAADVDATFAISRSRPVAQGASPAAAVSKRDTNRVANDVATSTETDTDASVPGRTIPLWVLGAMAALIVVIALIGFNSSRRPKPSATTTNPITVEAVPPAFLEPPSYVHITPIDNVSVQVEWDSGQSNGSVRYEVVVKHGSDQIGQTIKADLSPVRVDGLDLAAWTPCIEVTTTDASGSRATKPVIECAQGTALATTTVQVTAAPIPPVALTAVPAAGQQ